MKDRKTETESEPWYRVFIIKLKKNITLSDL